MSLRQQQTRSGNCVNSPTGHRLLRGTAGRTEPGDQGFPGTDAPAPKRQRSVQHASSRPTEPSGIWQAGCFLPNGVNALPQIQSPDSTHLELPGNAPRPLQQACKQHAYLGTAAGASLLGASSGLLMSSTAHQQGLATGSISCSATLDIPPISMHAVPTRETASSQQDPARLTELTNVTCAIEAALAGLQQHLRAEHSTHSTDPQALHAEGAEAAAADGQRQLRADPVTHCFQLVSAAADAVATAQLSPSLASGSRAGQPDQRPAKSKAR